MQWTQGNVVQLEITGLGSNGEGVGRHDNRVIFVPDAVTGDIIKARLITVKPNYAIGKIESLIQESPHRIKPPCIVAEKCGGCQWLHVDRPHQLSEKKEQIVQALRKFGGIENPKVEDVLTAGEPLGYRNRAAYPFALGEDGAVKAGYYRKGTHKIVNLNQCPVQDERLNPLLSGIKKDIAERGWLIYDEKKHSGEIRHLLLRIGKHTGEMLVTLVTRTGKLLDLQAQAKIWLDRYPGLKGVCLNINPEKGNVIAGTVTRCIAGEPFLNEEFAGLNYKLGADTFFQINTEAAEALLEVVQERLALSGKEKVLDLYCGVGTFTLPLAKKAAEVLGIEGQPSAVEQAEGNAKLNKMTNVRFLAGEAEDLLPELDYKPDVVLLDPPRKGCNQKVLDALLEIKAPRIAYISCNPATLARDLKVLCGEGVYKLDSIKPADFFPQTSHVESAAFLTLRE